ncbi:MAG: MBL fold metallo-hydrolase [Acidobacteria bacterium]|nr:MBL fold metallo-hydrolase [Acidobacteriota bacterium]
MLFETRAAAPFFKNGFLLGCETTRKAIVIDPGDEAQELVDLIERGRLTVDYILLTHAHMDHVSGVARMKRATGAPIGLHHDDLFLYDLAVQQGLMFGYTVEPPPKPDFFYQAGVPLAFGRYEVRVHHTPGHSPGGVALQVGPAGTNGRDVFVGDSLFAGSIGRTDLTGGDADTLINSIRTVLFALGDDAVVYPGHGPQTTIGEERRNNPFLQE